MTGYEILSIALVALGLAASLFIALGKAVRTITQDNADTAAVLRETITSEVGSLKLSMNTIQERHSAAVDKVETAVLPRLEDHEKRLRLVEQGRLLEDLFETLGRHKSKAAGA